MIFWPVYLLLLAISVRGGNQRGAAVMLSGAVVGLLHHLVYTIDMSAAATYWSWFMIAFAWFFALRVIGNKIAELACGFMSLYVLIACLDLASNPYNATVISYMYPVIICVVNIIIMMAGMRDKCKLDFYCHSSDISIRDRKANGQHSHGDQT